MIQYNLERLRSAPANTNYRKGFDAMLCEQPGCSRWKTGEGKYCNSHDAAEKFLALLPKAQKANAKCNLLVPNVVLEGMNAWIGKP